MWSWNHIYTGSKSCAFSNYIKFVKNYITFNPTWIKFFLRFKECNRFL